MRETTLRFALQLQPTEDVERAGAAVCAEGIGALLGQGLFDGVNGFLAEIVFAFAVEGVSFVDEKHAAQGLFDGRRAVAAEGSPQGPDHRAAGFQQEFKDGFFRAGIGNR